jgi:hypothetical protein
MEIDENKDLLSKIGNKTLLLSHAGVVDAIFDKNSS